MISRAIVLVLIVGLGALFYFGLDRDPTAIPSPLIGKPAPAFTATTVDGRAYDSTDLKGKVALVNFWATWCTTCKADEPELARIWQEFSKNPDFRMVGIVYQDNPSDAEEHLKSGMRPYVNLFDEKGRLAIHYGVTKVPETFLIDKEGKIVDKIFGPIDAQKLKRQISTLLEQSQAG